MEKDKKIERGIRRRREEEEEEGRRDEIKGNGKSGR